MTLVTDSLLIAVISEHPSLVGRGLPEHQGCEPDDTDKVPLAFMGQVSVLVRGIVKKGDTLVASGLNDMMAVVGIPGTGPVIGRAIEDMSGPSGSVKVLLQLQSQSSYSQHSPLHAATVTLTSAIESGGPEKLADALAAVEGVGIAKSLIAKAHSRLESLQGAQGEAQRAVTARDPVIHVATLRQPFLSSTESMPAPMRQACAHALAMYD